MKILFLTYNFISPDQPGSIRAWQIGKFLQSRGHEVTVVTSSTHYMTGATGTSGFPEEAFSENLSVRKVSTPVKNPRRSKWHRILHDSLFSAKQAVQAFKLAKETDLILSASPPILTPFTAIFIARWRRIKHVFEVRDILSEGLRSARIIRQKSFIKLIEELEEYCFRKAHGLIAVTPGIERIIVKKGIPPQKVKLITNGVEDELYATLSDRSEVRKNWKIPGSKFVVFFSGTLSTFSNVGLLLEAAKLLKNHEHILFIIAGDGQKRADYEKFSHDNELNNVLFLGAQPRQQIPDLCVMANVCVHMFKEGPFWDIFLSNKIFDYMGAGRAVIYAGGGDSAKLIRDANGGLVVRPEDASALKDSILQSYNDPAAIRKMGENARAYVLRNYSRRNLLSRMENYLKAIAGQD